MLNFGSKLFRKIILCSNNNCSIKKSPEKVIQDQKEYKKYNRLDKKIIPKVKATFCRFIIICQVLTDLTSSSSQREIDFQISEEICQLTT